MSEREQSARLDGAELRRRVEQHHLACCGWALACCAQDAAQAEEVLQMRVQYVDAIYHVMNRGDRREDIIVDDINRQDFLKTLAEACQNTGWQVHAYCLMRNHFQLRENHPGELQRETLFPGFTPFH